jgi:hypothetical protein
MLLYFNYFISVPKTEQPEPVESKVVEICDHEMVEGEAADESPRRGRSKKFDVSNEVTIFFIMLKYNCLIDLTLLEIVDMKQNFARKKLSTL